MARGTPTLFAISPNCLLTSSPLALTDYIWNDLLDNEDDTDGDGWPDDIFALL